MLSMLITCCPLPNLISRHPVFDRLVWNNRCIRRFYIMCE